jgi:hypothetical protein
MQMKKIGIVSLIFLAFLACKKAKGPADVKSAQQNNSLDSATLMSATINGESWKTDSAFSYRVNTSTNDTTTTNLMVSATNYSGAAPTTIVIHVSGYKGVNEYRIDPPENNATYYANNRRFYATSGWFNVLKDSANIITGTFSFNADTIVVTKGSFSLVAP